MGRIIFNVFSPREAAMCSGKRKYELVTFASTPSSMSLMASVSLSERKKLFLMKIHFSQIHENLNTYYFQVRKSSHIPYFFYILENTIKKISSKCIQMIHLSKKKKSYRVFG